MSGKIEISVGKNNMKKFGFPLFIFLYFTQVFFFILFSFVLLRCPGATRASRFALPELLGSRLNLLRLHPAPFVCPCKDWWQFSWGARSWCADRGVRRSHELRDREVGRREEGRSIRRPHQARARKNRVGHCQRRQKHRSCSKCNASKAVCFFRRQ
jgi:hypothetical protein